ncbi:adenylosuccinate synthetase isozyme 1 isoform X3 [Cavia porcellus]|uniref:adenylosuccinate synthetase isozyme 1 isoform X3 n=1 Tax=Cavia porcellus TaxID=10141 RepID=UPI002FE097D2
MHQAFQELTGESHRLDVWEGTLARRAAGSPVASASLECPVPGPHSRHWPKVMGCPLACDMALFPGTCVYLNTGSVFLCLLPAGLVPGTLIGGQGGGHPPGASLAQLHWWAVLSPCIVPEVSPLQGGGCGLGWGWVGSARLIFSWDLFPTHLSLETLAPGGHRAWMQALREPREAACARREQSTEGSRQVHCGPIPSLQAVPTRPGRDAGSPSSTVRLGTPQLLLPPLLAPQVSVSLHPGSPLEQLACISLHEGPCRSPPRCLPTALSNPIICGQDHPYHVQPQPHVPVVAGDALMRGWALPCSQPCLDRTPAVEVRPQQGPQHHGLHQLLQQRTGRLGVCPARWRQQCWPHRGGGWQGVRLPPAPQWHHQHQGGVLHRQRSSHPPARLV